MNFQNERTYGKLFSVLFLGLACCVSIAFAQSKYDKKVLAEILRMEEEYRQFNITREPADFERLHTDDYLISYSFPPKIMSRADFLALLKDPAEKITVDSFTQDDLKIRAYGRSTAIVTGRWQRTSRGLNDKNTGNGGRFTRVWVRQSGGWKVASAHYTPAEDPAKRK